MADENFDREEGEPVHDNRNHAGIRSHQRQFDIVDESDKTKRRALENRQPKPPKKESDE